VKRCAEMRQAREPQIERQKREIVGLGGRAVYDVIGFRAAGSPPAGYPEPDRADGALLRWRARDVAPGLGRRAPRHHPW
jgi:hypothetical protein